MKQIDIFHWIFGSALLFQAQNIVMFNITEKNINFLLRLTQKKTTTLWQDKKCPGIVYEV